MKWYRVWRARRRVILAAKLVESSYEPAVVNWPYDPDDLEHLREGVGQLRVAESGLRLPA